VLKSQLQHSEITAIENDLKFQPLFIEGYGDKPPKINVYSHSESKIFLPKFYGIEKFGKPDENRLSKYIENIKLEFTGKLRENQIVPVNTCMTKIREQGGGIICLPCGFGKTSCALNMVCQLGVKTLIIVSKDFLLEQWKERIQQFIPTARIGILQQKKIDIYNKDIVIGMLQSVSMCGYDIEIYRTFGLVIYDEVHCVPSNVFSKALRNIQTLYHLGLSATPNRKDGMTELIKLYIGPIIYQLDVSNEIVNPKKTSILKIEFDTLPSEKHYKEYLNYRQKPDITKMVSNVIECPKRISLIVLVINYMIVEHQRNVLVLSERIQYLHDIHKEIKKLKPTFKINYYIGGLKQAELKDAETADLLLASYHMAKEAMDIPILDTLFMVTSKGSIDTLEQCIGRIQRKQVYPENKQPIVIDFVDNFSAFKNQSLKRNNYYKKQSYPVQFISFNHLNYNSSIIKDEFNNSMSIIKKQLKNISQQCAKSKSGKSEKTNTKDTKNTQSIRIPTLKLSDNDIADLINFNTSYN
jgi:superfamily II DNA or RNA helicase